MELQRIFRSSRFCCECGEALTAERRPRWGGPRCKGCRAVAGARPLFWRALALALAASAGFLLGGRGAAPAPPALPPAAVPIPASAAAPPPPPEPLRPCGARTKRGTPCKRMVRGEGRCYQHGGAPGPP